MRTTTRRAAVWPMVALSGLFFVNTFLSAALAPRYAEIVSSLGLSAEGLGLALLGQAVGLTAIMLVVAPRLADRYGARAVARLGALSLCVLTPLIGLAGSWTVLLGAFVATGGVNAFLDLGMARSATDAEKRTGRTLITFLDIPAAVGSLLGATAGAATAGRTGIVEYAIAVGIAGCFIVFAVWRFLPAPAPRPAGLPEQSQKIPIVALCVLAAAGLGMQLAVMDWASLVYRELGAAPTMYGIGNVAFIAGATAVLLVCGPLADRFGPPAVLRVAAVAGIVGMVAATLSTSIVVVTVGLALAGAGLMPAHPLALSAAGRGSVKNQARVIGASYLGMAVMRPAVGGLSTVTSVQVALGLSTIALGVVVLVLAPRARRKPALMAEAGRVGERR
ncbi:MFS transporter [Plantactinospora solaniradicis]|uniref:MFS transporter n=2 Tax=Plantactinospora solaniradicis TaxID=1723736 RepID=A0ABW1K586_9ACTN